MERSGAVREGEGPGDSWTFSGELRTEMEKPKMKSAKVRIFFSDGLKRLGGARG